MDFLSWRVAVERMPRTAGVNAGGWTKRGNRDRRETGTGDLQPQIYIYRERQRERKRGWKVREGCFAGNWCQFNPALRSTWPVLTVREARWSLDDEGGGFVNSPFPRGGENTHARTHTSGRVTATCSPLLRQEEAGIERRKHRGCVVVRGR